MFDCEGSNYDNRWPWHNKIKWRKVKPRLPAKLKRKCDGKMIGLFFDNSDNVSGQYSQMKTTLQKQISHLAKSALWTGFRQGSLHWKGLIGSTTNVRTGRSSYSWLQSFQRRFSWQKTVYDEDSRSRPGHSNRKCFTIKPAVKAALFADWCTTTARWRLSCFSSRCARQWHRSGTVNLSRASCIKTFIDTCYFTQH